MPTAAAIAERLSVGSAGPRLTINKPYKGADSFGVEDGLLFYGRDLEARELAARVLSSRLTVLHAPSGAGKTSLLNARLISDLEERRWAAIRVRIDNDPVEAVRFAMLQYLMPRPTDERLALRWVIRQLAVPRSATLDELAHRFDTLDAADPRHRASIAPLRSRSKPSACLLLKPFGSVTPMFRRFLRGSVDIHTLQEHFRAIVRLGGESPDALLPRDLNVATLREIDDALATPAFVRCYEHTLGLLYPPVAGLRPFVENVFRTYGAHRTDFCVVLILDQFEEMFTRFIDPGHLAGARQEDLPDWRLRNLFFRELEDLYGASLGDADGALTPEDRHDGPASTVTHSEPLPLRFVISLREEYLGRLERIRRFAPEMNDSMYRLGLLPAESQAREAILQPADDYGYTYDAACLDTILHTLAREGFVEPFLLQIVCDSLWSKLRNRLPRTPGDTRATITLSDLKRVFPHGVQGIVDAYFLDLLAKLESPDAKADALELMETLITGVGTRNIVEERVLLNAPFRSAGRRQNILDVLVEGKFLRRERRLGSFFVEITHECLIASVQDQIREQAKGSRDLRQALRVLDGIRRGDVPWLEPNDFEVLDANHSRIDWPHWAIALMLQTAAMNGSREQIVRWVEKYETPASAATFTGIPLSGEEGQRYLTLEELRLISVSLPKEVALLAGHEKRVLQSLLHAGLPEDRDAIRSWVRRI